MKIRCFILWGHYVAALCWGLSTQMAQLLKSGDRGRVQQPGKQLAGGYRPDGEL